MNRRRPKNDRRLSVICIAPAVAAGIALIAAMIWENIAGYLDSHGWQFAGQGTPETIELTGTMRLERVMMFREGFRVCGVEDDTVIYSYRGKFGSVGLDGTVDVPFGQLSPKDEQHSDGSYSSDGVTLTEGDMLVLTYENGITSSVFDGWQLDSPRIYGNYVAARIYYCDCIYKIVHI